MPLDFPDAPTIGQEYVAPEGQRSWTWDGTVWGLTATAQVLTDSDVADLIEDDDSATQTALDTRYAPAVVWDDFSLRDDGPLVATAPQIGPAWKITGADNMVVSGGLAGTASNTGYLYSVLDAPVATMTAGVKFINPGTAYPACMLMAPSEAAMLALDPLCPHFVFGPLGFDLTVKQGSNFNSIFTGLWATPMMDPNVVYPVSMTVIGDRVTVSANGDVRTSPPDPRLARLDGFVCCWESTHGSGQTAKWGWASAHSQTAPAGSVPRFLEPTAGLPLGHQRQVVGGFGSSAEVSIGSSRASPTYPGIDFGATLIHAELMANAAAGQPVIVVNNPIPSDSVIVLDGDSTNGETVTALSQTGSGPTWSVTCTANLTKAHQIGDSVAASPIAKSKVSMWHNTFASHFHLPDLPILVVDGSNLYFGTALDTRMYRFMANGLAMGVGDTFYVDGTWNGGMLRLGLYHLWVDATGDLRIKNGAPVSDLDGTVVGTQS